MDENNQWTQQTGTQGQGEQGNQQGGNGQPNPVIIQQPVMMPSAPPQHNGMGVAGFVLALCGLFLSWVPGLGWILWILGAIFSCVGVSKKPRGLAIAGICISAIGLVF